MTRYWNILKLTGMSAFAVAASVGLADTANADAAKEKIVFSFDGTDGYAPDGALIADAKGNLYGTTSYQGGLYGWGVVFELSPRAGHGWKETVLYNFTGGADGGGPVDSLTFDSQGNLYGTTVTGGQGQCIKSGQKWYGCGVVFELTPSGNTWKENILYSFLPGQSQGAVPEAGVVFDKAGNLYGTTSAPNGTVFELSPTQNGWQYQDIYVFTGGNDGGLPQANLIVDSAGNLYGTTVLGGTGSCYEGTGCGVVFELTPGNGGWTETVLHNFAANKDGAYPYASLTFDTSGNLYGTTSQGGGLGCIANVGCGTVFELTPGLSGWKEHVLYRFPCTGATCAVGALPYAAVIMDASGNLYGTTTQGGTAAAGIIFKLKPGDRSWKETVLHTFQPANGDGNVSSVPLLAMPNGRMYGDTVFGGATDNGTVFELTP